MELHKTLQLNSIKLRIKLFTLVSMLLILDNLDAADSGGYVYEGGVWR